MTPNDSAIFSPIPVQEYLRVLLGRQVFRLLQLHEPGKVLSSSFLERKLKFMDIRGYDTSMFSIMCKWIWEFVVE